jgi:hypothetical protein
MPNDQQAAQASTPCAYCSLIDSVSQWMAHPFSGSGTAFQWVLTIGLVIVAIWFWNWTLIHLREEV